MFAARLASLRQDLSVIRACVTATERLRRLARSSRLAHTTPPAVCPFDEEARNFPSGIDWRVFDHCAAVTRLYAIYEQFATDVLESWLSTLPSLYANYSVLPQAIRKQHRDGIATILPQIGEGRFDHLNIADVIERFSHCLSGKIPYVLQPEAFLIRERNLRSGELDVLFARAGIAQCWSWIQHHKGTRTFVHEVLGSAETAESELNNFIEYRNDAAHGDVTDVLDLHGLTRLADFITVICEALAEKIQSTILSAQLAGGLYHELGEVTEAFPGKNVVVAMVERGRLRAGQEMTVLGRRYCFTATVQELQLNDVPHSIIFVHSGTEVGIRFERPVRKNAKLYQSRIVANRESQSLAIRWPS